MGAEMGKPCKWWETGQMPSIARLALFFSSCFAFLPFYLLGPPVKLQKRPTSKNAIIITYRFKTNEIIGYQAEVTGEEKRVPIVDLAFSLQVTDNDVVIATGTRRTGPRCGADDGRSRRSRASSSTGCDGRAVRKRRRRNYASTRTA